MSPGATLEQFLKIETEAGRVSDEIAATIECLVTAGVELAVSISFSALAVSSRGSETTNGDGDIQRSLVVIAQQIFEKYLSDSPASILVSEELEDAMSLPGKSSLCVTIDPLDGSSNIDTNLAIGSIGIVNPARYFMPNLLVEFNKIYPNIKLQLQVGNRQTIVGKLESLDLDIAFMGKPPDQFAVQCKAIGNHPQIIIAPADHEYADRSQLSFSKLKNQDFLLRETGAGTRAVADRLFKRSKFTPRSAIEFGSNETIKQAVIAGMGVALISAHTVAAELADKRLITLDVKGLPINRKWYIVKHKNKRLSPSSNALWEYIIESGKNFLPNGYLA